MQLYRCSGSHSFRIDGNYAATTRRPERERPKLLLVKCVVECNIVSISKMV